MGIWDKIFKIIIFVCAYEELTHCVSICKFLILYLIFIDKKNYACFVYSLPKYINMSYSKKKKKEDKSRNGRDITITNLQLWRTGWTGHPWALKNTASCSCCRFGFSSFAAQHKAPSSVLSPYFIQVGVVFNHSIYPLGSPISYFLSSFNFTIVSSKGKLISAVQSMILNK